MSAARLLTTWAPRRPEAAVVVLHGGGGSGDATVSPTQLSVLRMMPVAARVAAAGRGRLAVHRLLNTHRGWDSRRTPVADVEWALGRLSDRYGEVPVCLIGHSLGGRAALLSAGQDGVRSVVALNPWVQPTDRVDLAGRSALIVHGLDDELALASRSKAMASRAGSSGALAYIAIRGAGHAMLRHGRRFESYAADFALTTLLGSPPSTDAVRRALEGNGFVLA